MGGRKGGTKEGRAGRGEREREGEGGCQWCTLGTSGKQAAGLRYELRCNRDEVNLVSQAPGCLDGRNVGVDPGIDAELRDLRKGCHGRGRSKSCRGCSTDCTCCSRSALARQAWRAQRVAEKISRSRALMAWLPE